MNTKNFEISKMNTLDLDSIKDILEKEFDDFWNYSILKGELLSPYSYYIIAKQDKEIVRLCRF